MRPKFAYTVNAPDTREKGFAWSGEPERVFAALRAIGYDGVELFVRDPRELDPKRFTRLLADTGLKAAAIGTGPLVAEDKLCLSHTDPAVRKEALERGKLVVDFAAELQSQINIGKFRGNTEGDGKRHAWMFEGLRELAAYALQKKVDITIEPQNRFGCDTCTSSLEGVAWIRELNLPNVHLMLDLFHAQIEDASIPASLIEAAPYLLHVHFADTNRGWPGTGSIDFAQALHILKALRYEKFISVEIKQFPDSETAARNSLQYLHALCLGIWR